MRPLPAAILVCLLLSACAPVASQPVNSGDEAVFSDEAPVPPAPQIDESILNARLASGAVIPVSWSASGSIVIGSPSAKVTLREFMDYDCEYCRLSDEQAFSWLEAAYIAPGTLKMELAFLPFTSNGDLAARGAICAARQEKFLPMHAFLAGTSPVTQTTMLKQAKILGIETKAFQTCLQHKDTTLILDTHKKLAEAAKVERVPAFFSNDQQWFGLVDNRMIATMIEQELQKTGN